MIDFFIIIIDLAYLAVIITVSVLAVVLSVKWLVEKKIEWDTFKRGKK